MILDGPDPNPGRCLNHSTGTDAYGYPTQKRCLDYEGHRGACEFPADPPMANPSPAIYRARKPKPWVSPLEESTDQEVHDG